MEFKLTEEGGQSSPIEYQGRKPDRRSTAGGRGVLHGLMGGGERAIR